jgi:hypothetical protein
MTLAIEEVLAVWRDAERALDALPQRHPRRAAIEADIVQLRAIYGRLTARIATTNSGLDASAEQIASARETLERVRGRLGIAATVTDGTPGSETVDRLARLAVEPAEG